MINLYFNSPKTCIVLFKQYLFVINVTAKEVKVVNTLRMQKYLLRGNKISFIRMRSEFRAFYGTFLHNIMQYFDNFYLLLEQNLIS